LEIPVPMSPNYPEIPDNLALNRSKFVTFPSQADENGLDEAFRLFGNVKTFAFPQFFPQLWKTSGGDPTAGAAGEATVAHGFLRPQPSLSIDTVQRVSLLFKFLRYLSSAVGVRDHECDVPAKPPPPKAHTRLSRAHGNEERASGAETAPREGT